MRSRAAVALVAATLHVGFATSAQATNGYFSHGYGTHNKALAGAGVALSLNSLAPATNPASLAFLGNRWDVGVALFNPNRTYTIDGNPTGFPGTLGLTPGAVDSDSSYFPIPSVGANWQLGDKASFGVAIYGNGGMNTDWPTATFYGSSPTGVDLSQLFAAPTLGFKVDERNAIGVTGILAYQRFKAQGLQAFGGLSTSPQQLTNNDYANSFGGGFRVGYLGNWSPKFSLGASYQTRMWMGEFDDYAGLFAEQGGFDIPPSWTIGIAVKPTEQLDVVFDVQQVRYSEVKSVANVMLPALGMCAMGDTGVCLGTEGGPGFGWEDMTAFKGGLQLRTDGGWTWRAGYSWGEQPIPESEVLFNILAPGVMEQHLTFGFSKQLGESRELSFAVMRAFSKSVTGANPLEAPGAQTIDLQMDQWEFELGFGFGIRK